MKLIVSGVPNGEKQWGAGFHDQYIGTLYSNADKSANRRFDICLNYTNGKYYAYYHYMIYNIVSDCNGRDGSYFCLTLCFDKFFLDYNTVYTVLDILFRKKVRNVILQPSSQGERYTYKYPSFSECDDILKDMEEQARNIIGQNASLNEFIDIPNKSYQGTKQKINVEDATPDIVHKCIGANGSCSISSEYPRNIDVEWVRKVKEAEHKGIMSKQGEVDELAKRNSEKDMKIDKLSRECQDRNSEISRLRSENDSLQRKIEKYHGAKHVSEIVEPLREPISKLANYLDLRRNNEPPKMSFLSYVWKGLKFILACIALFCIAWTTWELGSIRQNISNVELKVNEIAEQTLAEPDSVSENETPNEEIKNTNEVSDKDQGLAEKVFQSEINNSKNVDKKKGTKATNSKNQKE